MSRQVYCVFDKNMLSPTDFEINKKNRKSIIPFTVENFSLSHAKKILGTLKRAKKSPQKF